MTRPETLSRLRELHDDLVTIHEELGSCSVVNSDIIEALSQLVTDVNILCDKDGKSGERNSNAAELGALADRINDLECSHPRIKEFLAQMTEVLRQI